MKQLTIGLFGFGVVGEGIYRVLLERPEVQTRIKKICVRHSEKSRNAPEELFTTDADQILNDPEINVVVELIDDAEAAYRICTRAIRSGKSVVSANKKMIAENLSELIVLQAEYGVSFLYEGAVCGSIPVIRSLEEYFDNDLLHSVQGIVNGSTNFILTQMSLQGQHYDKVLKEAQALGFVESDPSLDVEGVDATYKLSLILFHAFGVIVDPKSIVRKGITSLHPFDFNYAKEKGWRVKLLARTKRVNGSQYIAAVLPGFLDAHSRLFDVNNEFNGLIIGSSLADEQFMSGKGAGRYPTGSAVLSDISALRYGYKYENRKYRKQSDLSPDGLTPAEFYVSYDAQKQIDDSAFSEIHESYSGRERSYFTGVSSLEAIRKSTWWDDRNVSVISLN